MSTFSKLSSKSFTRAGPGASKLVPKGQSFVEIYCPEGASSSSSAFKDLPSWVGKMLAARAAEWFGEQFTADGLGLYCSKFSLVLTLDNSGICKLTYTEKWLAITVIFLPNERENKMESLIDAALERIRKRLDTLPGVYQVERFQQWIRKRFPGFFFVNNCCAMFAKAMFSMNLTNDGLYEIVFKYKGDSVSTTTIGDGDGIALALDKIETLWNQGCSTSPAVGCSQ